MSRTAKPWDLLNPEFTAISKDVVNERLEMCKQCEHIIKATYQCRKCGCFMGLKTKLANAECPIGKWGPITNEFSEVQ